MKEGGKGAWLFEQVGETAYATLQRPENHNVLTLSAIRELTSRLIRWVGDSSVAGVILRGADNRVFSTGGDLLSLYAARLQGDRQFGATYFLEEFQLDHFIATYPKPFMAVMNGLTLGGGAGIAANAAVRVVSDCTLFAMPETGLGYFPDCGASYFLNRCPGYSGTYLALTGQRLQAPDLYSLGLATHYVPIADLARVNFESLTTLATTPRPAPLPAKLQDIDKIFGADSMEEISDHLSAEESSWAKQTLATLLRHCPLSLTVTLNQMRRLRGADLHAVLHAEYRICQAFLDGDEFYEGIRALMIDKDVPRWPTVPNLSTAPINVASYFAQHPSIADWRPISS